jgi:hypothetical protein
MLDSLNWFDLRETLLRMGRVRPNGGHGDARRR